MSKRLLAFAGVSLLSTAAAAATTSTGTFTKSTAAAPADQVIPHDLGETPKAIILWSMGRTNTGTTFSPEYLMAWGMTDGTTSFTEAQTSRDGSSLSQAAQ